ncbi:MAG: ATP-dependent DNA helicase RecG [Candidatus Paceibacterota bacterium]|jgi:ATP-dependent DNA helicase RecG
MIINLDTPIESIQKLSLFQKKALAKMSLKKVSDILRHFPTRYGEAGSVKAIEFLNAGEDVVVFGKISKLKTGKTFKSRVAISTAEVEDSTGKINIIWFSQPYIAKMFFEGMLVRVEGRVSAKKDGSLNFSNPKIEKVTEIPEGTSDSLFPGEDNFNLSPVYPESRGISSNWIYHCLQKIFRSEVLENIEDPIPADILKKYSLPSLKTALIWIHSPRKKEDAEIARKRFAFEEIFFIQLDRQKEKYLATKEKSFLISKKPEEIKEFVKTFPFPLTSAQNKSIEAVLNDFKAGPPMSRLLEGDVGSGKTAVAATASFAAISTLPPNREFGNLQVAYMAPTEILAEQHFESFIEYFAKYKMPIGLITGSGAKKFPSKTNRETWTKISKPQLLKWVENGEIPILIGTHSLIQKTVKFKNLALIIIDEQHRFGVKQRMQLRRKHDIAPHLLSMTATPIPRTLALTIFGDLDLSLLDELPPGRQLPQTKIVLPHERAETYEKVRLELQTGRQVFVICPRVNDPDPDKENTLNAKSVKSETERLQDKVFPEFKVSAITGQMKPADKEKIMRDFKDHKTDILVATSVIEVGVNVPNATVIIIENAERFGLAQLHQLRGRVLRSSFKPYCFVFADSKSAKTIARLKSFSTSSNGFELAEADLQQRGTGDLAGAKQWGVSDLAMEALRNIKMVEAARTEARSLIEEDFELKNYPILAKYIASKNVVHME